MSERLKSYVIWLVIGGIVYFFLSQHIFLFGKNVKLLKKSRLTFENTFINVDEDNAREVGKIEVLRLDGINELYIEMGYEKYITE
ncbi:MAG: hypothetical protein HQK76_09490 [Desulfobacterales bacterium]|nr:hypothetical protein [Desulfobacterales bacterium]